MRQLGEIKFDCDGEQFAVEHVVRICDKKVNIPVMCVQINEGEGHIAEDLMSQELIKELHKTPAQRRAEKVKVDPRSSSHQIARTKNAIGRGLRLKSALGKFNKEVQDQLDARLLKFTRYEVFKQLQFVAGGKPKGKKSRSYDKVRKHVLKPKSGKEIKKKLGMLMSVKGFASVESKVDRKGKDTPTKAAPKVEPAPKAAKVRGSTVCKGGRVGVGGEPFAF